MRKIIRSVMAISLLLLIVLSIPIGVSAVNESELIVAGIPFGVKFHTQGVIVVGIPNDSGPASEAGLKRGDIITAINGTTITGRLGIKSAVTGAKAGDRMVLTVYRKGQTVELIAIVGEQIQSALGNGQTGTPKG